MHGLIHVIIFQEPEATEEAAAAEEEAQGDEGEQLSGEEPAEEEEEADDSEPKIDPDTGEPMPKKKKPSSSPDSNYINPSTYISEQRKAESDMDKLKSDIVEKKKSLDVWLTWAQTLPAADQSFFDAEKALALTRRQAISRYKNGTKTVQKRNKNCTKAMFKTTSEASIKEHLNRSSGRERRADGRESHRFFCLLFYFMYCLGPWR